MGVATRGVKFKFSSGEKVLCYEPDPTKAKVLYESKVLDLVVSRDNRGRKVPEYLIHFFGWNSSWDRCVREEFILSFTDENRELQTNLAKEAALSIKGKRRLPPLIKETLAKKLCEETANSKVQVPENVDSPSDTDSSEEETEVIIIIPDILKLQLEEDQRCITKKNKLVSLPCHPNVVAILEAFVKHSLSKMLCVSPPRNGKKLLPEDVQNKLSLYKEAVDGIRIYFDFTLPHLLLYPQERQQHAHNSAPNRSPDEFIKVEPQFEDMPQPLPPLTLPVKKETEPEPSADKKPILNSQPENVIKRKRGRPKLMNKTGLIRTLRSNHKPKPKAPLKPTRKLHPRLRTKTTPDAGPFSSHSSSFPPSSLKRPSSLSSLIKNSSNTDPSSSLKPPSPPSSPSLRRPSLSALVKQSCLPPYSSSSSLHRPPSPPLKKTRGRPPQKREALPPSKEERPPLPLTKEERPLLPATKEEKPLVLPSPCPSSSGGDGEGSVRGELAEEKKGRLLRETMEWRMLPASMYVQEPAPASLVYGAQHLLRLFVALPDLISKMSISSRKLRPLLSILEQFLAYLCEQKDQLFPESAYVDYNK